MLAFFLTHWLYFNYAEPGQPWYHAADWPNVFVILIVAPLGFIWSKTRFWPLVPLKHVYEHSLHHSLMLEEMHHFMHTGEEHPRVKARRDAGEHPTPRRTDA